MPDRKTEGTGGGGSALTLYGDVTFQNAAEPRGVLAYRPGRYRSGTILHVPGCHIDHRILPAASLTNAVPIDGLFVAFSGISRILSRRFL